MKTNNYDVIVIGSGGAGMIASITAKKQGKNVLLLEKLNIESINLSYPLAGTVLDIFFVHNKQKHFIDLIGYPGAHYEAFSIERYKTFSRIGIKTFPLHYSYWTNNKLKVQRKLKRFIKP